MSDSNNAAKETRAPRIQRIVHSGDIAHPREVEMGADAYHAIERARIAEANRLAAEFGIDNNDE